MSLKSSIIKSLSVQIPSILVFLSLIAPLTSAGSSHFNHLNKFSQYPHSFSDSKRAVDRLYKSLIMDDGRICACSRKYLFAFERNGTIAWALHLNYTCSSSITPVHGGSSKIYLVAENKVLKIYPLRIGTNEAPVEVFFECAEEIIGIAASLSSSCVLINVKNRGLFAYRLYGQLFWSAGPVLYQHGYRQGCRRNVTDCYFTSAPVIDQCEASIFMINTVGEVYSLSIRGHHFKWIQDLSLYGNAFRLTAGNNGLLYVTVGDKALVLALDVSRGNVLWQGSIGPLSSADHEPVVDANGWISYSSLDGFLYSFSATGYLKKFPRSASWSSVMQVDPVLDCSGYAIYISQTEMEGKYSQKFADYTHVSALKPKNVVFTSLVPASGSVLWFESDPSQFLFHLSRSDLQHFLVDERTLLTFFAVSSQKLASSCAQVKPKSTNIYIGNKRTITLFLMMESVVLLLLAVLVRFCCIFWKKKKLQGLDLGKFLEKRRYLRSKKKAFDKMITELKQKASEEEEVQQKLGHLVKAREGIKRRLSTTYSLGRDGEGSSSRPKSLLPLHDGRSRSYSFQGSKKENVTIFHTLSDTSDSDEEVSSLVEEADDDLSQDEVAKGKGKGQVGGESSSDYGGSEEEYVMSPLFLKHSFSEIEEVKGDDYDGDDSHSERRSLRRRTMSFTG
ncbi:protein GAMETE EXPRESSED 3 [Salvia hispanica]|uniref:protein GAMETE EXPRESSED 3 n=1 Tax=Salvia hispanica TaxID=49212 RepID=UPI0020090127|nr:protein GAMETE EXPRESSED 3 [Salvia hispanica]